MGSINNKNIILGISGGIAAYKAPELVRRLREQNANVRVVLTPNAREFVSILSLQAVSAMPVRWETLDSEAESGMDHIELARWADLIIVAPATANFIASLAHGSAENLLSTLCLASEAPIFLAPAMNRVMWEKSATQRNIRQVREDGANILGPGIGSQACGETGSGRMLDPLDIIRLIDNIHDCTSHVKHHAAEPNVLITAGPTWEAIDPVRAITNASSGKMGFEIARAFQQAGCAVTIISGPCNLVTPGGVRRVDIVSAADMYDAVHRSIKENQIFISVAAVADYRPVKIEDQKIKKNADELNIKLVKNPDILSSVSSLTQPPFCVGFAAETENLREYALDKLHRKKLDLIAANNVGQQGLGFNSDNNALLVLGQNTEQEIGPAPKTVVSEQLCNLILKVYEEKNST